MTTDLTMGQITVSIRANLCSRFTPAEVDHLTEYARKCASRHEWNDLIRADDAECPAWERAFVTVVALQDFLRALDSRLRDATPRKGVLLEERQVGPVNAASVAAAGVKRLPPAPEPEAPPPKRIDLLVPHADVAGYVYDATWVNGGIASYAPDRGEDPIAVRRKAISGIAAFRSVAAIGGIPEVAWFFCGADFELGISSWFAGVVGMMSASAVPGESNGTSPKGPGELAQMAAAEHRRIHGVMSGLAPRHERTLRVSYTDARCPAKLVAAYGVGVALIVWRAQNQAGETDPRGGYRAPGQGTLERLVEQARVDWPTFTGNLEDAISEEVDVRIRRTAELILWTAHQHYQIATAPVPNAPKPRRRRRRATVRPDLVQKGTVGRAKRQLVDAVEVQLGQNDDEPRAA